MKIWGYDWLRQIIGKLQNIGSSENQILIMQQLIKFEATMDSFGNNVCHNTSNKATSVKTTQDVDIVDPIESLDNVFEKMYNPLFLCWSL